MFIPLIIFAISIALLMLWIITRPMPKQGLECIHGTHQVIYPDGKRSQRMYKQNAVDYAAIFGGTVVKAEPKEKI